MTKGVSFLKKIVSFLPLCCFIGRNETIFLTFIKASRLTRSCARFLDRQSPLPRSHANLCLEHLIKVGMRRETTLRRNGINVEIRVFQQHALSLLKPHITEPCTERTVGIALEITDQPLLGNIQLSRQDNHINRTVPKASLGSSIVQCCIF